MARTIAKPAQFKREMVGGEIYEYYPLGHYVVRALGICDGHLTFKYTRIEVNFILKRIAQGKSMDYIR